MLNPLQCNDGLKPLAGGNDGRQFALLDSRQVNALSSAVFDANRALRTYIELVGWCGHLGIEYSELKQASLEFAGWVGKLEAFAHRSHAATQAAYFKKNVREREG